VRYLKQFLIASVLVLAMPALRAATSPGETSAPPLAPLVVEAYDKASGDLHLAYQTACGATGNTIYYAPMGQAGGPVWTGNDCGASASGTHTFHAGSCWIQPPKIKHTVRGYSDDCELLEIVLPANFETVTLK